MTVATALVGVGRRAVDQSLVGLLSACHTRIRDNLAVARRLATETGHSADEVRMAAQRVQRYFSIALPLHMADEDVSIAPRLVKVNAVLEITLDVLANQHRAYEPIVDWLVALCSRLADDPEQLATTRGMLEQTVNVLATQFDTHLELEELVVFPALQRLSSDMQAAIVAELRERRVTS